MLITQMINASFILACKEICLQEHLICLQPETHKETNKHKKKNRMMLLQATRKFTYFILLPPINDILPSYGSCPGFILDLGKPLASLSCSRKNDLQKNYSHLSSYIFTKRPRSAAKYSVYVLLFRM